LFEVFHTAKISKFFVLKIGCDLVKKPPLRCSKQNLALNWQMGEGAAVLINSFIGLRLLPQDKQLFSFVEISFASPNRTRFINKKKITDPHHPLIR